MQTHLRPYPPAYPPARLPAPVADFAVAGWKLHARQRSQMQGMVHHHMTHWNRGSRRQPPYPDSEEAAMAGGGNSGGGASQQAQRPHGHVGHGHAAPPQRNRLQPQQGREGPPGGGPLLGTSYLLDREVYRGLVRVVSALEVIPLQVGLAGTGPAAPGPRLRRCLLARMVQGMQQVNAAGPRQVEAAVRQGCMAAPECSCLLSRPCRPRVRSEMRPSASCCMPLTSWQSWAAEGRWHGGSKQRGSRQHNVRALRQTGRIAPECIHLIEHSQLSPLHRMHAKF